MILDNGLFIKISVAAGFVLLGVIALYFLFHLFSWIFLIFTSFTISMKKEYEKPSRFYYGVFNFAYRLLCLEARIKVNVCGLEKIPFGTRFLFVSNHRSNFDNMIESVALKKEYIAFLSKKENFKIPFGRHFMRRSLYQCLDRGNLKVAAQVILNSISFIKNDICSVGVFPEGTRSKDGKLLPFKDGCFKIAVKSKCPVVVGVIKNTEKIHKNFPFRVSHVDFNIARVIFPSEYENMSSVELSDLVYGIMQESLAEPKNRA